MSNEPEVHEYAATTVETPSATAVSYRCCCGWEGTPVVTSHAGSVKGVIKALEVARQDALREYSNHEEEPPTSTMEYRTILVTDARRAWLDQYFTSLEAAQEHLDYLQQSRPDQKSWIEERSVTSWRHEEGH